MIKYRFVNLHLLFYLYLLIYVNYCLFIFLILSCFFIFVQNLNYIIMILKKGVLIKGIKPECVMGILFAESIYRTSLNTRDEMVITSITDGVHMKNSLHYKGYGFDIRTNFLTSVQKSVFFDALRNHMDYEFDIVLEKTHIHVEYDPK